MRRFVIAAVLLLASLGAQAQETVFYKCTDAKGNVSMQNGVPCAAGMKQEVKRIGEVRTVPVPAKKPAVAEAPEAKPEYGEFVMVRGPEVKRAPAPEAAALPAPPALFQCRTWENKDYLGETGTPEPTCAALQVTGIDGSAALGMGSACEMKYDTCTAIPAEQLCAAWYRHLDDAEFKLKYAGDDSRPAATSRVRCDRQEDQGQQLLDDRTRRTWNEISVPGRRSCLRMPPVQVETSDSILV